MARKKIELFIEISEEKHFQNVLEQFNDKLICAEIYSGIFGSCTALDRLFHKVKFQLSKDGEAVFLKVLSDEIPDLERLRNQSKPFFMFIVNKQVTDVYRGANAIELEAMITKEIQLYRLEMAGELTDRRKYEVGEPTPSEMAWQEARVEERQQALKSLQSRQVARQAVRKRHRAELMTPHLQELNFVLYWPHCTHAHPELYERWDQNSLVLPYLFDIIMIGRDEFKLTKEQSLDVLYSGDAPINEASIHALMAGNALAICLKCLDPVDTVALVRRILYQDSLVQENEDDKTVVKQTATPYEHYMSISPTREQILNKRKEEKQKKIEENIYKRARRLSEMKRIAFQRREDAIEAKKQEREQLKMDLLKAGKLAELEKLKEEAGNIEDEVDIVIPEELSEAEEEESDVEDPDEYFPPPGLPIPGFYSPPNDIAKANGLAILFPKLVAENVTPREEFLPPHVLVMLNMHKRTKIIEHMTPFKNGILNMGVFKATKPSDAIHVAYTVKHFEALNIKYHSLDEYKLCFMVSTKVDVPLLELMDLNPIHVSRDTLTGEDECAALFPADYADDYGDPMEDFKVKENKKYK